MIIQEKNQDHIQDLVALPSAFSRYEAEQPRLAVGSPGKNAVANLTFTKFGEKTHLTDVYTELPAKILRELYYDPYLPGLPYILFMNPTGGIVQGDRYFYKFHLNEDAEAFITDTMATKIYKMDLNYASKNVDVYLSKNSRLEFLPRETISFVDSRWYQYIIFHVAENSKFLYSEIFCPGRIARGEFWDFEIYSSKILIEENRKLLLLDSSTFMRQDKEILDVIFGSNKYLMKTYWYSENAATAKNQIEFKHIYGGVTEMAEKRGLTIKALSNDLNDLRKNQIEIWRLFRKTEAGTEVPQLRMY
jgi:urease accessory protein